jgi:transposase
MGILYGAIDLHSSNCYCGIIDGHDQWVAHRRLRNNIDDVKRFFGEYKTELNGIAMESTYNSYWLMDGLREDGYNVRLANPSKMGDYEGLKNPNDMTDTRWLAKMLRLGILPEGYIYPKESRPMRDLLRRRTLFVGVRTKLLNSMENQFQTWLCARIGHRHLVELSAEEIYKIFEEKYLYLAVRSGIDIIKTIDAQVSAIEKELFSRLKDTGVMIRLRELPGIDRIIGMTIALETGDIKRFKGVGNYLSYCRLVESVKRSNNKSKGSGNRKCGNSVLRWAYAEAAVHALRYDRIRSYYQRMKRKKGCPKALAIIASKIARVSYKIMADELFRYEEERLFN